jgi:hypothetical protein
MATPAWVERLKKRWGLTSNVDFAIIFCVFAFTGTFTAISKRWFFAWAGLDTQPLWLYILCYIAYMLIAYQIILLTVGTIAGFPRFFWAFVKRFTNWLLKPFGIKL